MRRPLRWLLAVWLAAALPAAAEMAVLELRHRSAAELLPLVRPVAPGDAVVTGRGKRLVVRGTATDIHAIRDLVRTLDTTLASLRISLRTVAASGSGDGAQAAARVHSTRRARESRRIQSVRAVEGRPARIDTGGTRLLRDRALILGSEAAGYAERTRLVRWADGFLATARLHGESVSVTLSVAQAGDPAVNVPVRDLVTTVRGPLGEWLAVGAVRERARRDTDGVVHGTRDARRSDLRLQLRVQRLD